MMFSLRNPVGGIVSIGELAKRLGVSEQTIRNWSNEGQIPSFRSFGGHRRFNLGEVFKALGLEQEERDTQEEVGRVAAYVRVSSKSQENEGSLLRQKERLLVEVSKREGIEQEDILVVQDVASAFGKRRGLNKLVDLVLSGSVNRIYVEYHDRLSRVPALTRLMQHLCTKHRVEIVALDREEQNPDEVQAAMLELVEFTTVISNRIHGRKGGGVKAVQISEEGLK